MEEKIVYFEKLGKENTAEVIELVLERVKSRNINRIVLASTREHTAKSPKIFTGIFIKSILEG